MTEPAPTAMAQAETAKRVRHALGTARGSRACGHNHGGQQKSRWSTAEHASRITRIDPTAMICTRPRDHRDQGLTFQMNLPPARQHDHHQGRQRGHRGLRKSQL